MSCAEEEEEEEQEGNTISGNYKWTTMEHHQISNFKINHYL